MALGSYLEYTLQFAPVCGDSTRGMVATTMGYICLSALLVFSFIRICLRLPDAIHQIKLISHIPVKNIWSEVSHITAVLFAIVSVILFIVVGHRGLGTHLCSLGLTEDMITFIKHVLPESGAQSNEELINYLRSAPQSSLELAKGSLELAKGLEKFLTDVAEFLGLLYVCSTFYQLALTFQKVSIALSLLSMFGFSRPSLMKFVRRQLFVTGLIFLITLGLGFFGTWPASASWNISTPRQWSLPASIVYTVTAGANVLLDGCLGWIPLYYMGQTQLSTKDRWAVIGLALSQWLSIIFGAARCFLLTGLFGEDLTYRAVTPLILTMVQMTFYVLSFSVPTGRQLWRLVRSKYAEARTSIRHYSQQIRHSRHGHRTRASGVNQNIELQPYKREEGSSSESSGVPRSESSKSVNGNPVVPAPFV